jgi:hypothetical protein
MKIIFAIFAIACGAWLVLRDNEAPVHAPPLGSIARGNTEPILPGSTHGAERPDGGALLRSALDRLERYSSLTATLRVRIRLFDHELIGAGMYQQAGQGGERRLRFELKTQLGDRTASQVEICDGAFLWSYREIGGEPRLSRLDLKRVRDAQMQVAGASLPTHLPELVTGGLPHLLQQSINYFQPHSAEAGYLNEIPVWAIDAEWKPAVLSAIAPGQKEQIAAGSPFDFAKLPQIPERVTIFLGHEDLFPLRIDFLRRRENEEQSEQRGRAGEYTPIVTLEFTDVQFDRPIDPRQFDYQPGIAAEDVTDRFLQTRGLTPRQ